MRHENLSIKLDLTYLGKLIRAGVIEPHKYVGKDGAQHQDITLLVTQRKNEVVSILKTPNGEVKRSCCHYCAVKEKKGWKPVKNKDGGIIYVGEVYLSFVQPTQDIVASDLNDDPKVHTDDLPF